MPYALDDNSLDARHAQAAAGVNTLGAPYRPQLYWPNGQPITDADFAQINQFGTYSADEDARRFGVGQSNVVAARKQTALEHADQVQQAKALLKQRQSEFNQTFGLDTQKFGESTREFNQNFGEGQRRFDVGTGADLLKTASTLRGPLDFVQGDMYAQGVTQGYSPFIQALRTGQPVQYGGGTATNGNPTPLTVGALANTLMGGTGAGAAPPTPSGAGSVARPASTDQYGRPTLSPDVQSAVDAGSQAFTSGLANKPLGWYENQTTAQKQGLQSIGDYLGRNTNEDIQYYQRSRPGQGSSLAA